MKKIKVERRFFTKIAALVLGLIIWVIIINVEDADFSTKINDIPVQISGETVLEKNNLVVANKGEIEEASISVRGKRSDVINYMDDIYATADVSKITEPGEYNIKVSYDSSTNTLYITERKTSTVKIVVEKMQKKEVEVLVLQKGASLDSGRIIESVPKARKVTVRAAAEDINKIAYVAAEVDVSGMLVDSKQVLPLVPVDAQQKVLTFNNNIYMSIEETEVENKIHSKLTVPVRVEVKSSEDAAFIITSQSFDKVDVGVTEGAKVQEVKAVLNYSPEAGTDYIVELEAKDGVYIPRENKTIEVKLKVVPRVTKTVTLPLNIEGGEKVSSPMQISVEVTGAEEEISAGNITATANVAELGSGIHTLPVSLEFKKTSLSALSTPTVTLTIE